MTQHPGLIGLGAMGAPMAERLLDAGHRVVIEESVIQRTIGSALRTGGEFAEVFVEDKRSSSALLDDGRIEELTSGRDRGAGIRVVVGDTTGFAHTADLSEDGLATAARAAAAAARGGGGARRRRARRDRRRSDPRGRSVSAPRRRRRPCPEAG